MYSVSEERKAIEKDILNGIFHYDDKAWERFIDEYEKSIYYSIRKTVFRRGIKIPEEDINDLYLDFLLSLLEKNFDKLRRFEGRHNSSLKTYLWTLASNYTKNWIDKLINHPFPQIYGNCFEEVINIVRDYKSRPDESIEEKEVENSFYAFQEMLDTVKKNILSLLLEEKSPKEIIKILGIPRATVYRKIKELKTDLLNVFNKNEFINELHKLI